jgi:hypothetical protein
MINPEHIQKRIKQGCHLHPTHFNLETDQLSKGEMSTCVI